MPLNALTQVVAAGTVLFRVHDLRRAGNEFNPGKGGVTRFAPVAGENGVVSSLYAAETHGAAICETLLHDVPLTGGILPLASYATRTMTGIKLARDLKLAMFLGQGLRRLGLAPQDITATNGDVYERTVLWAQAAHAAGFEGLAWMSARDNSATAYTFFGDRVAARDLQVVDGGLGAFAPGTTGFESLAASCSLVRVELLLS